MSREVAIRDLLQRLAAASGAANELGLDLGDIPAQHGDAGSAGARPRSMHRPFPRRQFLNCFFPIAVNVLENPPQVAHVKPLAAAGAFLEMIGFGLGDAVGIPAGISHSGTSRMNLIFAVTGSRGTPY
jgi:hypothetical protein